MVFSSTIFVFAFLPVVLVAYYAAPRALRNLLLLAASLLFYAWGEIAYVGVMVASIALNHGCGLWIAAAQGRGKRAALFVGLLGNLGLLGWFKYANFVCGELDRTFAALGLPALDLAPVHLPIGISFFTFQAISYLVDVHRGTVEVQRRPIDLALYIALFPQLIAGPIVRYADIAGQIRERRETIDDFAEGVRRFVVGFGKKMLIANTLAVPVDSIFALPPDERGAAVAWLGLVGYALQLYFDFSGYSDMAIGLGRMFGFRLKENFNYPFICRSIREFWQRWHISLSTWLRDYLYLPLGGNRASGTRVYANLFVVYLLCGLWHGASWNFVLFGAFHGSFMALERMGFEKRLRRLPVSLQHVYAQLVLMFSWVLFRCETLPDAMAYTGNLFGSAVHTGTLALPELLTPEVCIAGVAGLLGSTPWIRALRARLTRGGEPVALPVAELLLVGLVFAGSAMKLALGTHNPFIYFRF